MQEAIDEAPPPLLTWHRVTERSLPQPDLMLLRPRADFYESAQPTAADVLLLIFRKPQGDAYTDITATETPGPTAVGLLPTPGIAIDLTGLLG